MKQRWDASQWKKSTKLLLALATAWPYIYLILFFGGVLAITFFLNPDRRSGSCGDIGINQLEQKMMRGELKELVVRPREILARNRSGTCEYRVWVPDEYTRKEILRKAREVDANGSPLVPQITEEGVSSFAVAGFIAVFVIHMLTIVVVLALIAIYVVLAVNNRQFDQTKKIIWVVGLCMLTTITMPVYWYLYVWRKPTAASAPPHDQTLATL